MHDPEFARLSRLEASMDVRTQGNCGRYALSVIISIKEDIRVLGIFLAIRKIIKEVFRNG